MGRQITLASTLILIATTGSTQTGPGAASQLADMNSYSNSKFGYTVDYPKSLMRCGRCAAHRRHAVLSAICAHGQHRGCMVQDSDVQVH